MLMQSVATTETTSARTSTESNGTGPGEGPMRPGWIVAVPNMWRALDDA